ncbi:flagellar protein FlaG [Guptibacillus hwajinpoensis]|uniref:flagellar protein FlaG n=1 Tax=Guptibacillus hwajinpoensis TaxID=208199 RepID=UPI001CFECB64|nr:flagellar protein FlaG [Pseudalkalibacillus hwajinpoensis]WLR57832.1 flagellar protein FlaG [Pseudalkalibacillus hwajinpoensis]
MEVSKIPPTSVMIPHIKQTEIPTEPQSPQNTDSEEILFTKEALVTRLKELNDFIEPAKTNLKFQLHDQLNEYYVQIIDTNTDEVLKEIPSKELLDRYAATAELLGFLVDQKI